MILLTAIGIAYFIQQHIFIDFKPFNCLSCLSFWVALILSICENVITYTSVNSITTILYICKDMEHIYYPFSSYILVYLITIYERK
jgi:hypothetical protein